jgi:excisionase family DNA binding protein
VVQDRPRLNRHLLRSSQTGLQGHQEKLEGQLNFLAEPRVKRAGKAMRRSLSDVAPLLTVKDLAHYLKVHPSTVYRLLKAWKLPAFKLGRDWRFNVEDIDRWRVEHQNKLDT